MPTISNDDYVILKSFDAKEGYDRHSAKIELKSLTIKITIMTDKVNLRNLNEDNVMRKIFVKNESSPFTQKENNRLYTKMRKLKDDNLISDGNNEYIIIKGKL